MNSNVQKSSTQLVKTSQISSNSHHTQNSNLNFNQNISPMSRVSILKTEEQKEIVRTNIFEPNNVLPAFTVVTEVIKRKSNIHLDSKPNSSNKIDINFSFNKPLAENNLKNNIQNKTVNINIVNSKVKIKNQEGYKLLIKRIASQLKAKIRPPTHGFFFFAMQKGTYPLMIIKKFEDKIINHSIDLNSDFFQVYSDKYLRYRELVKRIAHLLKHNMKKMFWENDRYKNQSIQVKVTNISTTHVENEKSTNDIIKNKSISGQSTIDAKKNVNVNVNKNIIQNKKATNAKINNAQVNNTVGTNSMNNQNQKKNKTHTLKTTIANVNNKSINTHQGINQSNIGNHKFTPVINPFNAAKSQTQAQVQKKLNFAKKVEPINKSTLFNNNNNRSLRNKNVNNNKNEVAHSSSSETNKSNKIKFPKFTNNVKHPNPPKDMPIKNSTVDNMNKEETNISNSTVNQEKTQFITIISKRKVNTNNEVNNEQKLPNIIEANNNDIEMADEANINEVKQETIIDNVNQPPKTNVNMKIIPHRNTITTNVNTNITNIEEPLNNKVSNNTAIRQNEVKKITFDSVKSPGRKLTIKLSTFRKAEDIINSNIEANKAKPPAIPLPQEKIDICTIIIPCDNSKVTDEHISFINKFNVLMSSNGILLEYNIPMTNTEEGRYYLKKNEFWTKFVHYLCTKYLIDKKNKISMFSFIYLIEQYFLWCEIQDIETANKFKALLIETMNKFFNEQEIKQFLSMNKMNNLEELFKKYELFMKYGKRNNYISNKEIEIKIDNGEECNCELCQSEKACVNKISEINKKSNIDVNVESIQIQAEYSQKKKHKKDNEAYETNNNYSISLQGKNSGIFSKSKTMRSIESVYQYFPPKMNIKEEKEEEEIKSSEKRKKSNSKNKESETKEKKEEKKEEKENFIDVANNAKIDEYFKKEEKEEQEEKEDKNENEEENEKKSTSRKKSTKRNNNKKNAKKKTYRYPEESDHESEEEKEKEKEKDKKKKKRKSKSRNKSYGKKYIDDSDSQSESDESDITKYKNKKNSQYPRRKKGKK